MVLDELETGYLIDKASAFQVVLSEQKCDDDIAIAAIAQKEPRKYILGS